MNILEMKSEAVLREEFELINRTRPNIQFMDYFDLLSLYPTALCEDNYSRNRYRDVLPEEKSRVRLLSNLDESDYINASFIKVHKQKYISCQAPLPNTISHFWCMVWEQNSPVIVMLTRTIEGERKKADVYWPDNEGEMLSYGKFTVTLKSVKKLPFITIRTINLARSDMKEQREIVHLHYTEWPDFGVPETTHKIRELIQLVSMYKEQSSLSGPLIAHCSAGIGRVGTFLAILIALEKLTEGQDFESLNLVEIILEMRKSRCGMVQTDSQYAFIYRVLDDIVKEKQLKVNPKKVNTAWRHMSFGVVSSDSDSEDLDETLFYQEDDDESLASQSRFFSVNNELASEISCQQ